MSANGEKFQSNPDIMIEKPVETEKVIGLKSKCYNSTENGSDQIKEGNLSTEKIIQTFFCVVNNQRKELRIIEENLSETIQKLKIALSEHLDTSENVKKFLREQIEQGMILLKEIRITLSDRESRESSMLLQLAKFRDSLPLAGSEASADGLNNNLVKTEQGSSTPQTITDSEDVDETSDDDLSGKKQMELDFVETILKAAKIRQKMAKIGDSNKEDSNQA